MCALKCVEAETLTDRPAFVIRNESPQTHTFRTRAAFNKNWMSAAAAHHYFSEDASLVERLSFVPWIGLVNIYRFAYWSWAFAHECKTGGTKSVPEFTVRYWDYSSALVVSPDRFHHIDLKQCFVESHSQCAWCLLHGTKNMWELCSTPPSTLTAIRLLWLRICIMSINIVQTVFQILGVKPAKLTKAMWAVCSSERCVRSPWTHNMCSSLCLALFLQNILLKPSKHKTTYSDSHT